MEYGIVEYALFFLIVIIALIVDLIAHKKDENIPLKSAVIWSMFWISVALCFNAYIYYSHGSADASAFFTGYLLEKSLSVDNLFVIMAIFMSFGISGKYQHRILYYGILGAIVLRMIFVAAGSSILVMGGKYALGFFGIFVLWSAYKMWSSMENESDDIEDYTHHFSVKWVKNFIPIHPFKHGHDFFMKKDGVRYCTPLFLCLICVEVADVMFAFDSVPAVIAITQKPFLVYTSNIFAILGLRSLYFLLAAAKDYLCHLTKAVVGILFFIGIKMLLDVFGFVHITPQVSLIVVATLLSFGFFGSFLFPEKIKNK